MDEQNTIRFWKRVQVGGDDECWPWTGYTTKHGNGTFIYEEGGKQKGVGVTRVAYEADGRVLPRYTHVYQSCGHRDCCNPKHQQLTRPALQPKKIGIRVIQPKLSYDEEFWSYVEIKGEDECWPWLGTISEGWGYGKFRRLGTGSPQAHRIAYELTHNIKLSRKWLRHRCNNRACCNPSHLYVGGEESNHEEFWAKVDIRGEDDCWEWTGARTERGYGQYNVGHTSKNGSHRKAYAITKGPIPEGMCVCHSCDNPPCCNPKHLWVGTLGDNNRDAAKKGRNSTSGNRGRGLGNKPLLSDEQVAQIKAAVDVSICKLAKKYDVTISHISKIRNGHRRANVVPAQAG